MFSLENKIAYVAGGSGLIGSAIVNVLKAAGGTVYNIDVKEGADIQLDLSVPHAINQILDRPFDIFVNATYPQSHMRHIETFLTVSSLVCRHFSDLLGGSLINIGSIYGVIGSDAEKYKYTQVRHTPTGYSAAKGAIISITRALAAEYGPSGVRVNCVSPGGVYSDDIDAEFLTNYIARTPLRHMATPQDVAYAVLYLASDEASYVTGVNLLVDGGFTISK